MMQATTELVRSQKRSNDEWIVAINEMLGHQRRPVFDIGDLLIDAEGACTKKAFRTMVEASGLKSRQNANNYMRVARAPLLRKSEYFNHLPTSVGALIDLASWTERELSEGIRTGVVHAHSERAKLQKWRTTFNFGPEPKDDVIPKAHVVAYIMCNAETYSVERAVELWQKFDEIKQKCLPEDMHVTPYERDVRAQHRLEQLWKRVWAAYVDKPELFVNPRFHSVLDQKKIQDDGRWFYIKEVAPIIASGDHKALHKVLKFSKSDWSLLGVSEVGHATLIEHFVKTD